MIYSTVGVPSRASEWCERILHRLVRETGSDPAQFVADDLEQIGARLLCLKQRDAVITSRIVESKLCAALISDGRPVLVSIGAPEDCVKSLITDYGVAFPEALRRTARSLNSLLPLLDCPHALVLDCSAGRSARQIAEDLIGHFELNLSKDAVERALDGVPANAPKITRDLGSLVSAADREDLAVRAATASRYGLISEAVTFEAVVKGAAEPVWAFARGEPLRDIEWHPLLLLLGDAQAKPPVAALDISGDSRCLVYGPYIGLPKGTWTCRLALKIDGDAAGANLLMEIYAGDILKSIDFPLRGPGLIDLETSFRSPGDGAPIELRLFKRDDVSEGLLVVSTIVLHPERSG